MVFIILQWLDQVEISVIVTFDSKALTTSLLPTSLIKVSEFISIVKKNRRIKKHGSLFKKKSSNWVSDELTFNASDNAVTPKSPKGF